MIKKHEVVKQENSSVKLSVTVDKKAADKEYNDLLQKYSKEAVIKGFRKGKVPVSVLENKFGEGIRQEVTGTIIDSALQKLFEEIDEKPLGYSRPVLEGDPEYVSGKDLSFEITYDIFPEIKLGEYKGLKVAEPQVAIAKKDEEDELKKLQEQNSFVIEKKDKTVAKDAIITIDYVELNDKDEVLEATKREDFTFTVGSGMNYYKIDDEVIGMKAGEEKVIEKSYDKDFSDKALADTTKKIKVKVKTVKEKQLPKLDDDFAQDISEKYEKLDDLKKEIKDALQKNADDYTKQKKMDQLMDQIREASEIAVPESMLNVELESDWRAMLQRMGATEEQMLPFLQQDGNSKEKIMEGWKPEAEKRIKNQLIMGKIIEDEKIEATDDELAAEITKKAGEYGMKEEDYKNSFGEDRLNQYLKNEIAINKLFDFLLESAKITKGDKIKYADLNAQG